MMRILLIEDSLRLRALLAEALGSTGFFVDTAGDIETFRDLSSKYQHDLYVVDLGLPDGDGISLIKEMRVARNATPVMVVTARSDVTDRVLALEQGADDYLVKPFNQLEFMARVRAILRRPADTYRPSLRVGHLDIELGAATVWCKGTRIELTLCEHRLLRVMARRFGQSVPREAIEGALGDRDRSLNALDKSVSRLRKTLKAHSAGVRIRTVWGVGYVLEDAIA
jgi:DNA-binding response OmpR family regulator